MRPGLFPLVHRSSTDLGPVPGRSKYGSPYLSGKVMVHPQFFFFFFFSNGNALYQRESGYELEFCISERAARTLSPQEHR